MNLPTAGIYSEAPTGGDRFWLDQMGEIAGLFHQTSYPGGDSKAGWQITLDPNAQHRAWAYGRKIGIVSGATTVWRGFLDDPSRDTTWTMSATGAAAQGKQFTAIAATSNNALNLSEILTAAVARGLPWTLPGSFPTMPTSAPSVPSASQQCDTSMDQVCAAQTTETYWLLDRYFNLTFGAAPTTPTRILYATTPGGGRSLDGFVTDVYVVYQSASGVLSNALRSATSRPFGRFEQPLDETAKGLIATSDANGLGDGFLARNSARAKYGGNFTPTRGQLVNIGGQQVDLAGERAGFLSNVINTDPDSAGEVALSATPAVLMGTTSYDWDAGLLTLTPVYSAQDDLTALLGAGSAQ